MKSSADQISTKKLMEDLSAVVNDAEDLLKATASQTGERISEVRAKTEESLRAAKVRLADAQEALLDKAKAVAQDADAYAHENPWKTAGIAAAAGLLIGALIARR